MGVEVADELRSDPYWQAVGSLLADGMAARPWADYAVHIRRATVPTPCLTGGLHVDAATRQVTVDLPAAAAPSLSPAEQAAAWADSISLLALGEPRPPDGPNARAHGRQSAG